MHMREVQYTLPPLQIYQPNELNYQGKVHFACHPIANFTPIFWCEMMKMPAFFYEIHQSEQQFFLVCDLNSTKIRNELIRI